MKLVLRQGSYENETLISGSATEQDIQSALLSIDPTKSFELVADDGATIQTAQSEENLRYWVNLTEVSRFGKKHCQGIDGQLGDLRDVIRAFNYFLILLIFLNLKKKSLLIIIKAKKQRNYLF